MREALVDALLFAAALIDGCSSRSTSTASSWDVVIMSGGGAVSPFTTPTQACSSENGFLSAGNTDTALRDYLLAQGKQVYTAPTKVPWGTMSDPNPTSFGPFKDCPIVLPESMTVMSADDVDAGADLRPIHHHAGDLQ